MATTTSPPTTTRNPARVVADLRHIADLIERAHLGELAADVQVYVTVSAGYGVACTDTAKRAMVDQVAALTGQTAAMDKTGGDYGMYRTTLDGRGAWQLLATAWVKRPDPNADLHAEVEQLRAKVAALQAAGDAERERGAHLRAERAEATVSEADCPHGAGCDDHPLGHYRKP